MIPRTLDCPYCEFGQDFFLVRDQTQHLRQCTDCDQWFVIHEQSGTSSSSEPHIEMLGEPPACPVDGCTDTLSDDQLVTHLIAEHEASLTSD